MHGLGGNFTAINLLQAAVLLPLFAFCWAMRRWETTDLVPIRPAEGEALPSVRQISADLQVNPLTVTRAYQSLVDIGAVESRRGMGMYVQPGAHQRLLVHERQRFLTDEWPRIAKRLAALELDPAELLANSNRQGSDNE